MDTNVSRWIFDIFANNKIVETIAKFITYAGNKYVLIAICLLLLCFKKTRKIGIYAIFAGGFAYILNDYVIKFLIKRDRPFVDFPEFKVIFDFVGIEVPDGFSMASGHSATTMAFAIIITLFNYKFGIIAILYSILVGASRIFLLSHYLTDVLVGFALGIACAFIVYFGLKLFEKIFLVKKQKIVFASNNKHKLKEVRSILNQFEILSLSDIGFNDEIAETGETLEENAKIKCSVIYKFLENKGIACGVFADDTGLFVNKLNGEPGVYSARYAENHDDDANRQKLLKNLAKKKDRSAYFECVIYFKDKNNEIAFSGKTEGEILKEYKGDTSFGYDCIFYSNDLQKSFGESSEEEKNSVSHRGRAVEKLKEFLINKKDMK